MQHAKIGNQQLQARFHIAFDIVFHAASLKDDISSPWKTNEGLFCTECRTGTLGRVEEQHDPSGAISLRVLASEEIRGSWNLDK
jgi:hypothetical protein